ncbi:MAG: hypothetical protein AAF907_08255, partial [Planctomycetota bacterium]
MSAAPSPSPEDASAETGEEAASEPHGRTVAGLTPAEWRRRALHFGPGLLAVPLWFVPHRVPLSPILRGIMLAAIVGLTAFAWFRWRSVRRSASEDAAVNGRFASVFGYAAGPLLTLFCFPDRPECGLAVLGVLAFG